MSIYLADCPVAINVLNSYSNKLKALVEMHIGIPVGVGIGSTKIIANLVNHTAKKYPATKDVCVLENIKRIRRIMQITDIDGVWVVVINSD